MTDNPDRIERTLELLLYAPIGIGLFLKDAAPTFVDMFVARGRAEIDRRQGDVQQRVTTARSLGQVAMAFGPPIVRQKVEKTVADARQRAEGLFGSAPAPEPVPSAPAPAPDFAPAPRTEPRWSANAVATPPPSAGPSEAPSTAGSNGNTPYGAAASAESASAESASSADLPIPGYDALSASQVVERLIGLAPGELDAVHAYESSHRQRRTILGKIEQLAG